MDRPQQKIDNRVFWGEIAPYEHLVEIYADESAFLDSLTGFVSGGLHAYESVIVIAAPGHRETLAKRLRDQGVDLDLAIANDHYIAVDAEETLAKFMIGRWPDDARFSRVVTELLKRAKSNGRHVRAFGEMVALLWAQGYNAATIRLEHLWHEFCQKSGFSLFCAYPRSGFTEDIDASMQQICAAHSKVIANGSYLSKPALRLSDGKLTYAQNVFPKKN